ncbi:hypothetical protein ABVK25_006332 [Lepraria finkii]|uniref:Uncharacterized protein n=1 Tax=Lepraria finkii TaxID=1340010 RepID=A0ABR4B641_9LECA
MSLSTEVQVDGTEKFAAKSKKIDAHGATGTKSDQFQGQAHDSISPKTHSPPRLNNFSFSSESLNQPDFSGKHTPSLAAACTTTPALRTSQFAISKYRNSQGPDKDGALGGEGSGAGEACKR